MNLRDRRKQLLDEAKHLAEVAKARPGGDFTANEVARIEAIKAEVDELTDKLRKADEAAAQIAALAAIPQSGFDPDVDPLDVPDRTSSEVTDPLAKAFVSTRSAYHGTHHAADGTKSVLSPAGATMVPVSIGAVIEARPETTLAALVDKRPLGGSDRFSFLRQTVRNNQAAPVPIGATKPTSVYTLDRVEGQAVTVAHLSEPIPRQWLADVEGLQTFVSSEMSYGLTLAIDDLLLNGSTVEGAEVGGVLNTSGVRVQAFAGDELTTTRTALTVLETAGESPTAFVLSPGDWQSIETQRDGTERFLVAGQPQQRAPRMLHGLPVVVYPGLPAGLGLLGDWRTVSLLVREGIRLDWTEAGADLFDKNMVKFRAECRVGVAIKRPGALSVIELSSGGSN